MAARYIHTREKKIISLALRCNSYNFRIHFMVFDTIHIMFMLREIVKNGMSGAGCLCCMYIFDSQMMKKAWLKNMQRFLSPTNQVFLSKSVIPAHFVYHA